MARNDSVDGFNAANQLIRYAVASKPTRENAKICWGVRLGLW